MLQEKKMSSSTWAMNYKELNILLWRDAEGKKLDILTHFLRGDGKKKKACVTHIEVSKEQQNSNFSLHAG